MAPPENHPPHGSTSPGSELSQSTRQPSQLSVLLAGAGTPPLTDPEQARLAPVRLFDAFVLSYERSRLFFGHDRALFKPRVEVLDPRHDALARLVRSVAATFRQRMDVHDATAAPGTALLRGVPALAPARLEGALTGFDVRRAAPTAFTAELMLGSLDPEVDPLDAHDAGVLRRFIALAARGLVLERPSSRGGVVSDLGGVTLALALLDLVANPRSALRAARARLAKSGRLGHDEVARVRDVGQALREILAHAVGSATTSGAPGRDLTKESSLAPELMDHLAVALARAVYDGLAPEAESPLVVPSAGADALTVAPLLAPSGGTEEPASSPLLGLYNRVAFVPLPYARGLYSDADASGAGSPPGAPATAVSPPRPAVLDEPVFARAREALHKNLPTRASRATVMFETRIDPTDPRHAWTPSAPDVVPAAVARAALQGPPGTHLVVVVGSRGALERQLLDTFAQTLAANARWCVLAPRPTDRTLAFGALEPGAQAGSVLRRADLSRWLDADAPRAIHWDLPAGCNVLVNAAAMADPADGSMNILASIARDVADKADPRALILLAGAPSYADAAAALGVLARHPELESGAAPVRSGSVWLVRTDAPLQSRFVYGRGADETALGALAELLAPGSPLCDLAVRAALLPPEAKYRGRMARLVALTPPGSAQTAFSDARRALERAAQEPWSGSGMRRALQAGVASLATARGALSAGLERELLHCLWHELALLVSEWDGAGVAPAARTVPQRLADLARGQLAELVLASHPRAALILSDALAGVLAPAGPVDWIERASVADALHAASLSARAAGTLYGHLAPAPAAPAAAPSNAVPLGFVLRGGPADLYALVEVHSGSLPPRAFPSPQLELTWRVPGDRDATLGNVALMLLALFETARRWGGEIPMRPASREGRATFGALLDVSVDAKLVPESARLVVPLRPGIAEADAQRLGAEFVARLTDLAGGGNLVPEWNAHATLEGRGPAAIPLSGPMLMREFAQRWARALKILPRYFPLQNKPSARYSRAPAIANAAELGLPAAVMAERGINPTAPNGRALLARLPSAAADVMAAARELGAQLPVRNVTHEGPDPEVLERYLGVAWFLHANFCTLMPGPLTFSTPDGHNLQPLLEMHLDRTAIRHWLQRKVSRPQEVDQRAAALLSMIEPSVIVD